jgi:hypothetical protein
VLSLPVPSPTPALRVPTTKTFPGVIKPTMAVSERSQMSVSTLPHRGSKVSNYGGVLPRRSRLLMDSCLHLSCGMIWQINVHSNEYNCCMLVFVNSTVPCTKLCTRHGPPTPHTYSSLKATGISIQRIFTNCQQSNAHAAHQLQQQHSCGGGGFLGAMITVNDKTCCRQAGDKPQLIVAHNINQHKLFACSSVYLATFTDLNRLASACHHLARWLA